MASPRSRFSGLATEDHDVEEVSHLWVFDETARPTKIEVSEHNGTGQPVGTIPLRDLPIQALARSARRSALRRRRGGAGGTHLSARCHVRRVLSAVAEGTAGRSRPHLRRSAVCLRSARISSQFLADAVARIPGLLSELLERNRELLADGYHAQVNLEADSSLLFLFEQGKRVALRLRDGQFRTNDRTYSVAELQARKADLSPNALLRPVMQDYLFPTVAYVGGPAELAYMAQSQVIYRELLGRMPVMTPRNGFTLLDGRAGKLMLRYGLQVPDLFDYQQVVRDRIAAKLGARLPAWSTLPPRANRLPPSW